MLPPNAGFSDGAVATLFVCKEDATTSSTDETVYRDFSTSLEMTAEVREMTGRYAK
jgi:hypothetical protein